MFINKNKSNGHSKTREEKKKGMTKLILLGCATVSYCRKTLTFLFIDDIFHNQLKSNIFFLMKNEADVNVDLSVVIKEAKIYW